VIEAVVTSESLHPDFHAFAFNVVVEEIVIAPSYSVDDMVGSLPSVV
jgi:hypothetical protein